MKALDPEDITEEAKEAEKVSIRDPETRSFSQHSPWVLRSRNWTQSRMVVKALYS